MGVAVRETTMEMAMADRQNHREFAEQAPHDAAHHQDGNEDGDERDAHRHHREADLFGAFEGRLPSASCRSRGGA